MGSLHRIVLEGFRSFRRVELEPGPVTVLIGPNGSGKSNLLAFLRMVPMMRTGALQRFIVDSGGASSLLHYGPKVTREVAFQIDFRQDKGVNSYSGRLGWAAGDTFVFLDEQVSFLRQGAIQASVVSLGAGHAESRIGDEVDRGGATARTVGWLLSRLSFFHFHDTSVTSSLRTNSRVEDSHYLRSDGSNLGAYLLALKDSEPAAWRRIGLFVRKVAPFVKELLPTLVGPAGRHVRLDWADDRDEIFGTHHLSDGTLRAIALITALAQPTHQLPAFISIDEPELGLHPAALLLLCELIQSVSDRCQILLATQSPALLDYFGPESVLVAEREAGVTELHRLDPVRLHGWMQDYSLSQLYDKNVLGGRP